jgi:O-antigen ligase
MGAAPATIEPIAPPKAPASGHNDTLALILVGLVGAGCGVSAFFDGYYDLGQWGPIAIGAFLGSVALAVAIAGRPSSWSPTGVVAVAALALLAGWAMLSSTWAESADQALTNAGRWALYAAFFGVVSVVLDSERCQRVALAAATGGVLVVAGWVVASMLAGETSIFLEGRLNDPLGYVNGEAGFFLLAFWPLAAVAERARSATVGGLAAAAAAALASLMVVTQSRGVAIGAVVSAVILLAVVPGRLRRLGLLLLLGVVVAGLGEPLRGVYDSSGGGARSVTSGAVESGGIQVLVVAITVGAVWALALVGLRAYLGDRPDRRERAQRVATRAVVAGVAAIAVIGVVFSGRIADGVSKQWNNFASLEGEGSGQRLVSGGGDRYDFWRIALQEAGDQPLVGVGAGNYAAGYFRDRRTEQDIRQPHSLPLQTLAELGAVGLALLVTFLAAVAVGLWRWRRILRRRVITIAAGGAFFAWFFQSSVDWLALIPGLTGFALLGAAALVASPGPRTATSALPRQARLAVAVLAVGLVAFAGFTVARLALADRYQSDGAAALASDPSAALRDANNALDLNPDSMLALYTKARALARMNRYDDSHATLLVAAQKEPHNFVPWTLLGDLALARGESAVARGYYRTALALNPRDTALQGLAATR